MLDTHDTHSQQVNQPKFSTTMIMVRPRQESQKFELLLVKRAKTLRVLPGFMVFPGGVIEQEDLLMADVWLSQKPVIMFNSMALDVQVPSDFEIESSLVLGEHVDKTKLFWSLYATGLRELYEETGVLLLSNMYNSAGVGQDGLGDEQLIDYPSLTTWRQVARDLKYLPSARYFGRRVTPSQVKYRFDTHYFICTSPTNVQLQLSSDEIESAVWATPSEILNEFEKDVYLMAPPTVDAVSALNNYQTLDELLAQGQMPLQVYDQKRVNDFISRMS